MTTMESLSGPSEMRTAACELQLPLSSECGTYKTVKAILWPWLSGKRPYKVFPPGSQAGGGGGGGPITTIESLSGPSERRTAACELRSSGATPSVKGLGFRSLDLGFEV